VNPCVLIPCYNHGATVGAVARGALAYCPVLVVDDGSAPPVSVPAGVELIRFDQNRGKAAALRAGFDHAAQAGFTHVITMDADAQHAPADLPKFLAAVAQQPDALVVGIRDFVAAGAPGRRRRANAVSNFWFRIETGIRLPDTQCGFRCYPLALVRRLQIHSGRYAYELEVLVRAVWAGAMLVPVAVRCSYQPAQVRQSHFRPWLDSWRIANVNARLVWRAWVWPAVRRRSAHNWLDK
jgi:glycosyltransferase involved in cell wall biosynthesis